MQHGGESALPRFLLQDARHVGVGLARMDDERQTGFARSGDVGANFVLRVDDDFRPAGDVDLGLILSLRSGGLLVPVIAAADRLSVEMMARTKELTRRARAGRLRGTDLAPPSITVLNLGDQGVESVLGVIYPPQVALVGFGAVADRPWAVDGMLGVRPLFTVTLAGDHRATDGTTGSRLLKTIDRLLQTPGQLSTP